MNTGSRRPVFEAVEPAIATAYNEAGYRYGKYADGDARNLFTFDGRHAYSDRKTWNLIEQTLFALRKQGLERLRVLDIGCGPGTWLRRVVVRARQLGFCDVTALGIDIAETQLLRARALSRSVAEMQGVHLSFAYGDLRAALPAPEAGFDLTLCLYGVLNHVPKGEQPGALARIAAATRGYFIAAVRAVGSTPTVYVDDISSALRFYQDNRSDRLDVEFANGRRTRFHSHLFSREELRRLAAPGFEVDDICGLDLFHGRFGNDPRWNPPTTMLGRLAQELVRLEERYCRDPGFVDHATHLLMTARNPKLRRT